VGSVVKTATGFWFVRHGFEWYQENPRIISWNKEYAMKDSNWKAIKPGNKIVYYATKQPDHPEPEGLVGLFNVKSEVYEGNGDLRHDIEPLFYPITDDWKPKKLKLKKDLGFNSVLQGTVNKLTADEYRSIKREILGMDEPDSHEALVALFAKVHPFLGFPMIRKFQQAYPDVIAEDKDGKVWNIELEYDSDDFRRQEHDPKGCNQIVCWEDGWGNARKHTDSRKLRILALKPLYGS
jgi:hypothetical protein